MSEIELKPCPMCGSVAQVNTWTMHGITESRCFCPNSDCPNSVRTVALATWNTRPIEDALNARITELDAAQRWIPVSERLPFGEKVLVLWKDRTIHLDWTFLDGGGYYWWNSGQSNVTHWMPLPPPPEGAQR